MYLNYRMRQEGVMENGGMSGKNGIKRSHNPTHVSSQRKLVLHFDVRNTILVADSVTNDFVEQALNSYLTGVTWGREANGEWEWVSDKPSLCAPTTNCMTYYKHREKHIVKTPSDRAILRQVTGDFTQEPLGSRFLPYFNKVLKQLQWPHPSHPDTKLTMTGKDGNLYHYILPSFFKLIQHLHSTKRDFAIVIRTYGLDAPNVLQCIDYSLQGHHPRFQETPLRYPVNPTPGSITRDDQRGKITLQHSQQGSAHTITSEQDIYRFLSQATGISGYVDDFTHWQNNQYNFMAAKPHWLDFHDPSTHHIFFDDNLRVTDEDSIVNVRVFPQGVDHSKAASLDREEITKLEDVCLVLADLIESTADMDYFIKKVQLCETNYKTYLEKL